MINQLKGLKMNPNQTNQETVRDTEIRSALDAMRSAVADVQSSLHMLRTRLDPVLHPPVPCNEVSTRVPTVLAPLAIEMVDIVSGIGHAQEVLTDISSRLEV